MNISKLKIVFKYMTGGVAGVVEYVLDAFNEAAAKLPSEDVAKYAALAGDAAKFVCSCCGLIRDDAKKRAAQMTAAAFADLASALSDAKLTKDELDAVVASVKAAVAAWKEAA